MPVEKIKSSTGHLWLTNRQNCSHIMGQFHTVPTDRENQALTVLLAPSKTTCLKSKAKKAVHYSCFIRRTLIWTKTSVSLKITRKIQQKPWIYNMP